MPRRLTVPTLYFYSLQSCCTLIIPVRPNPLDGMSREQIFDMYPAHIVTDLMETALIRRDEYSEHNKKILFAPTLRTAIIKWSMDDFELLVARCPKLTEIIAFWSVERGDDISKDIRVIGRQRKVKRLIFPDEIFNFKDMYHSESGRLPTLYTYISCYMDKQLILRNPEGDNSSFDVEIYFDRQELSSTDIAIIIKNCQSVRVLKHKMLLSALCDLHYKRKDNQKHNLRNLNADANYISRQDLKESIQTCPKVSYVDFNLSYEVRMEDISPFLLSLNTLQALELSEMEEESNEILYSIIDKHGHTLRYLSIFVQEGLDVDRLLSFCTNLEHLELGIYGESCSITDDCLKLVPRLRKLALFEICRRSVSTPLAKLLMCNSLVSLKLSHVTVDPKLITSAIKNGCWRNLVMLDVYTCDCFKLQHVIDLLVSENELALLEFGFCKYLNKDEKKIIEKMISDLMLGVHLIMY